MPRSQIKTAIENIIFPKNQIHEGRNVRNSSGAPQPPKNSVTIRALVSKWLDEKLPPLPRESEATS